MIKLKVLSPDDRLLASSELGEEVSAVLAGGYAGGERILVETSRAGVLLDIQLEDSMPWERVYVPGASLVFFVPPLERRPNYSPRAFVGNSHLLRAREVPPEEAEKRRNLARNAYDQHENDTFYPHAHANVETRNEAVFAARNAIDGIYANSSHGNYPYQSWGINRDPNAALTLDFGRAVRADEVRLTLRADFPHDNYWVSAVLHFDDGTAETLSLVRTAQPQCFAFAPRLVRTCTLDTLIPADGPSPFPALTQFELWGTEA